MHEICDNCQLRGQLKKSDMLPAALQDYEGIQYDHDQPTPEECLRCGELLLRAAQIDQANAVTRAADAVALAAKRVGAVAQNLQISSSKGGQR